MERLIIRGLLSGIIFYDQRYTVFGGVVIEYSLNTTWDIFYTLRQPDLEIADFVESFWVVENRSETAKDVIVLPDGRIDVFFSNSMKESFTLFWQN